MQVEGNPNERVREAVVPFTAEASFPMLEYLRGMREDRTGVTRYNQGSDADSLNKTKGGIEIITNRADMRIDLRQRLQGLGRARPEGMLRAVEFNQVQQRHVRIERLDDERGQVGAIAVVLRPVERLAACHFGRSEQRARH